MKSNFFCEKMLKAIRGAQSTANMYFRIPSADLPGQWAGHQEHQEHSQWAAKLISLLEILNEMTESKRNPQGAAGVSENRPCVTCNQLRHQLGIKYERKIQLR